jgi:hypothetical protein
MGIRFEGTLTAVVVSAVVSSGVAVAATEALSPAYAGAAPTASVAAARVSLSSVDKLVAKDNTGTQKELSGLTKLVKGDATSSQVSTVRTDLDAFKSATAFQLAGLNAAVGGVGTQLIGVGTQLSGDTSSLQGAIGAANSTLSALSPVIKSSAERLYDTCALTSSLWQRSFPNEDGGTSAFTTSLHDEALSNGDAILARDRCYSAPAVVTGSEFGGIIPSGSNPDDLYTATP